MMYTFFRAGVLVVCSSVILASPTFANARWSASLRNPASSHSTTHILVKKNTGEVERIPVNAPREIERTLTQWKKNGEVDYIEPDGLYHALGQQTSWGFTRVKATEAATTNAATGSGVIIAVVDTGVDYNHEDLDANNWINTDEIANDNLDNDNNGYIDDTFGYDFIGGSAYAVTPDDDPQDEHGHGTHVAGIIAAENNTVGTRGVAPSATIMPVKVLDASGAGYDSTIAEGIRYAVNNGAHIINLSLGGPVPSHTLSDAIDVAVSSGVLVIAAAGNENSFTFPSYPAAYPNVISVGATTADETKAVFSNWGKVDVVAPGEEILSTSPGNLTDTYSGTSIAAPHVAGVAAVIRQTQGITNVKALRHIIETTTDDFGTQAGADYVAGQGIVNALTATSTRSPESYLFADGGWLISDAIDAIAVTVSVRTAAGAAVANDSVTWSTTKGTLTKTSSTTDANGEATVNVTADDVGGLATITADPASTAAATIQIAIVSDIPQPDAVGVSKVTSGTTTDEEDFFELLEDGDNSDNGGDNTDAFSDSSMQPLSLSNNLFAVGDRVVFWAWGFGRDHQEHATTMTYHVTDADGATIEGLEDATTTIATLVGDNEYNSYYSPAARITSAPITLPDTFANGSYTLIITLTDTATGEIASRSTSFWVGEWPEVLLVNNHDFCDDTPLEAWDVGGQATCSKGAHEIVASLESLGYDVMLWDTMDVGAPTADDLKFFPVVVWLDSGLSSADTSVLQGYLDAGGNVLLSSEYIASSETDPIPTDFAWKYLHARSVSTVTHPDSVLGVSDSDVAGQEYNIDYFDLNGNGARTTFDASELELNTEDDAEELFQFTRGESASKTAGIRVDTGTYRLAFLSFGIESIHDGAGDATKAALLDALMTWLRGATPAITAIRGASTITNSTEHALVIRGKRFQMTGTTSVKLGKTALTNVSVTDRSTLHATVPAGMRAGTYRLTVTLPDGRAVRKKQAVRILRGGAVIESLSAASIANDTERTLIITGSNFTQRSRAFLGSQHIETTFDSSLQLRVKIPAGFNAKRYTLTVKNPGVKIRKAAQYRWLKIRVGFDAEFLAGARHPDVKTLERRLKKLGYFEEKPDSLFDERTQEALLLYQNALGIQETGELDYVTRYRLNLADADTADEETPAGI